MSHNGALRLPVLYKRSSTGAIQSWEIGAHPRQAGEDVYGAIVTHHGQVGGAIQTGDELITKGKNIGRSNETTPLEQARVEAEAKWTKKKEREGYVESLERAQVGETDQAGGIAPMLAKAYDAATARRFTFPAFAQRKYDGIRCIAQITDGRVTLWSRKREAIVVPVPHIIAALEKHFADKPGHYILDGELYRHGWSLQKIASFARQKTAPKAGFEQLGYHIYDLPSAEGHAFAARTSLLGGVLRKVSAPLHIVDTVNVIDYGHAKLFHDQWVGEGYEGAILRGSAGLYERGKRSSNLLKLKFFQDAEFEIISVGEGRGKFAGLAMFTCNVDQGAGAGKTFDCCAPGSLDDRRELLKRSAELVGKKLTVKFFDWTDDGLPHFPVGKAVRDYE